MAFAINTPNRIGEYGGRVLFIKEGNRIKAISLAVLGSISQLLITLIIGTIGLLYLRNLNIFGTTPASQHWSEIWVTIVLYGTAVCCIVLFLFYFRLSWLVKWIEKLPGRKKWMQYIAVLDKFETASLLRLLSLSVTRYIIFTAQYLLLTDVFLVNVNWWQGFWLISVMFLILAVIPTFALAELGIRGKVAIFLLGNYSTNYAGILSCTIGIWIINLVIPALMGSLLILSVKLFSNK